jgi:putative SOS response-associated peptidase YedK
MAKNHHTQAAVRGSHEIRLPFTFAGLWEGWKDPESGEWLGTCKIITGEPNELVSTDPFPYAGDSC